MPTPKAMRAPPSRRFENYTFTRVIGDGANLAPFSDDILVRVTGAAGNSGADDEVSDPISIGFNFEIDGITYTHFVASTNGWMALVDPSSGTFNYTEVMNTIYDATSIIPVFSSDAVLIAPWFDDLRNTYNTYSDALGKIVRGISDIPTFVSETAYGIRYNCHHGSDGMKRLVVRWHSQNFEESSYLIFDVVISENGTIQFNYAPRNKLIITKAAAFNGAAIGIFMPNGTKRFRDMSIGLGVGDVGRQAYVYGGAIAGSSYVDPTYSTDWNSSLIPFYNWPGSCDRGASFTFSPPVNKRKILSRITKKPINTYSSLFDDRKIIIVGNDQIVNYPTIAQRMYANGTDGIVERQDLFSGDFELTRSVDTNVFDDFTCVPSQKFSNGFSENHLHEQGKSTDYYLTGSSIDMFGSGLSNKLSSKVQLRLSLPVDHITRMLELTSSIYYYNGSTKRWNIPKNANGASDLVDAGNYLLAPLRGSTRVPEDARGFGPVGNVVVSGSIDIDGTHSQTDPALGRSIAYDAISNALSKNYSKNVQLNRNYAPTSNEVFNLTNSEPIIIEKVVFDIPMSMGPGWFNDRTTCNIPYTDYGGNNGQLIDFAGPAITLALFCVHGNVALGSHKMDLILTGTIIPSGDQFGHVKVRKVVAGGNNVYVFAPQGFPKFNVTPAVIVQPNTSNSFTGSVYVETQPGISNGITLASRILCLAAESAANAKTVTTALTSKTIDYEFQNFASADPGTSFTESLVFNVDPFGRASTGFDQSGRSIFGKEFATTQASHSNTGVALIPNPVFVSASAGDFPANIVDALADADFYADVITVVPFEVVFPSPYVVMPGDKLTLALSKMRPVMYTTANTMPVTTFTGSLQHDVLLITGSINMTFYGSYLREGRERDVF